MVTHQELQRKAFVRLLKEDMSLHSAEMCFILVQAMLLTWS